MEQFSLAYIEKCIEHKEKVHYMIERSRGLFSTRGIQEGRTYLQSGDHFHCPDRMKSGEIKTVNKVIAQTHLEADDPSFLYPIGECVLIPTESQLAEGLKATNHHLDKSAFGQGPAHLLDEYLRPKN